MYWKITKLVALDDDKLSKNNRQEKTLLRSYLISPNVGEDRSVKWLSATISDCLIVLYSSADDLYSQMCDVYYEYVC